MVTPPHEDFNPNAGELRLPPDMARGLYQAPPPIRARWAALYAEMALRLAAQTPEERIEAAVSYMTARYRQATSWTAWLSYRTPQEGGSDDQPEP